MNLSSYPPGSVQHHPANECLLVLVEASNLLVRDAGILSRRPNHALVLIFHGHRDEPFLFQRGHVSGDLPGADVEKFGEIAVGSVATAFVVQAVDFNEQDFFHQRKLIREPNLPGNPHAFEVTARPRHTLSLAQSPSVQQKARRTHQQACEVSRRLHSPRMVNWLVASFAGFVNRSVTNVTALVAIFGINVRLPSTQA